ncbi:MAG: ribonuclease G [Wenzhouxiangellaceae bacterium]|nr:ribonuclease G [Wenzhouxiangellaceae bacterium]
MSNELLINVAPSESRVALIENGLLQELHLERLGDLSYVGNIYMGRIERVLPGMQAAFVEIGLSRTAFLHAGEIMVHGAEAESDADEPQLPPIAEMVREGQCLPVQVIKDPMGSKGARLTTRLSLPSRYLVYLPDADTIGVSLRIDNDVERTRLRELVAEILSDRGRSGTGLIVRTNGEGISRAELEQDLDYLERLWARLSDELAAKPEAGTCIYEDLSLPLRALRDLLNAGIERVRIDDVEMHARAQRFMTNFLDQWADRLELFEGPGPLFDLYGVEDEIGRALKRNVALKSGGYLTIDQTEAMTTVDVNTGGFVGTRNFADTIFKTNLEASQALARQLRLRNLGGIVIIDFIDMDDEEHKRQVMRVLQQALARDPARSTVSEISALGLVEMTRKRTTESLEHRLCEPCPLCNGRGWQKSVETVCSEIFREILRAVRQFETGRLMVMAAPRVVDKMLDEYTGPLAEVTERLGTNLRFQAEDQYSQEQFDVVLL